MPNNTGPYVTTQQVKDTTDVGALTDPQIDILVLQCMAEFDARTRNFFNERAFELSVEGNNTSIIHMGIPILEVVTVKLNGSETPLDTQSFTVFKSQGPWPDDRKNPRIKLYNVSDNIFVGTHQTTFLRGTITKVDGKFGYLEPDGSTPLMVQQAILAMVTNKIKNPIDKVISAGTGAAGGIQELKREKVDLHEKEWFESKTIESSGGSTGQTGIKMVDDAIKMFRAPITMRGSIVDVAKSTLAGYVSVSGSRF